MHYVAMRMTRMAVLALVLCTAVNSIGPAYADATPSPTSDSQSIMALYKAALTDYLAQMKLRDLQRMKINQIFMSSVNDANRTAKSALRSAKTPTAKSEVLAVQKAAIALANSVRDAAILAMGQPPIEPVKPTNGLQALDKRKIKSAKATPTPSS